MVGVNCGAENTGTDWSSVYVIAADNGEVKIGYSYCPLWRFSNIRREYAAKRGFTDAKLVGYIEAKHADVLELLAHRHFREHWISGEWFAVDPDFALSEVERLWAEAAREYGEPPCRVIRCS